MKVGVLTYHRARNYGAYLQAYGLCKRLNEEADIEAEIIDFHMKKEYLLYNNCSIKRKIKIIVKKGIGAYCFEEKQKKVFRDSLQALPLSDNYCVSDDIHEFIQFVKGKYDIIIAGSDEIWKLDSFRGFPTPYWLIGELRCKKITYAASSRSDFSALNPEKLDRIKLLLDEFVYISVRDTKTEEQIKRFINPKCRIDIMPDPSLIYHYPIDKSLGRQIIKKYCKESKPVALIMTENSDLAKYIKCALKEKYQLVSVFHYHRGYINISELKPLEWLNVIASVDLVLTSYFHASCFSLVNNTPFLAFGTKIKSSKLEELLDASGCSDRFVRIDKNISPEFIVNAINGLVEHNSEVYLNKCKKSFLDFLKEVRNCY